MDDESWITLGLFCLIVTLFLCSVPVALEWRGRQLEEQRCGPSPRYLAPIPDPRFMD